MEQRVRVESVRAFGGYGVEDDDGRSWAASLAASSGIYLLIGALVAIVGGRQVVKVAEKAVDVTFVQKVVTEPPPPPPMPAPEPPKPEVKPAAPAAAAPIVRPDQKIRKLDAPPKPKQMVVPKEMPKQAAPEADPSQDKGVAVYGEPGHGDPAGLEGGQAGGVAGGKVGGVIALPEDADPPAPLASNTKIEYPEEARDTGKTAVVVLKVVILADGSVASVELMRGEEPFASAAMKAVKNWKYTPAHFKGQPISVYRIIQIPFKLTA